MVKHWNVWHRTDLQLPLRKSPIKFAVNMSDGRTSNAWRVWTEDSGAYICCRDNFKEIKISLHRSGRQHIAFRQETGIEMTPGSRFWNRWHEPPQQGPATPSFKLVFPSWGVRLTEADRSKTKAIRRKWDDNQILLEGDDEILVTVSLLILDHLTTFQFVGDYPSALIGVLPLSGAKSLFVVASKEPEGNFRSFVEAGLAAISPEHAVRILSSQEGGDIPVVCLTGDNPDGYAIMVFVPVEARVAGG